MARTDDQWEPGPANTFIQTTLPGGYDILINGLNKYLNFNSLNGVSGYGLRDNAGVMQIKNSGGAWGSIGPGTVTNVASADGSITVINPTTTVDLAVVKAPKLSTARTIAGVSFDGTANISLAASNLSDGVTGSGAIVLANAPTLINPVIGAATATTLVASGRITAGEVLFTTLVGTWGNRMLYDGANQLFLGIPGTTTAKKFTILDSAGNSVGYIDAMGNMSFNGFVDSATLQLSGKVTKYNNITVVSNGVPSELATIDSTGLTANVGATTLYTVPVSGVGMYRVSAYLVTITAASVSSTMPNAQVVFTDNDSNTSVTLDVSPILGAAGLGQSGLLTANTVGTVFSGTVVIYVKASTTIQYQTVNYASTAAGMTYALRIKLEAL